MLVYYLAYWKQNNRILVLTDSYMASPASLYNLSCSKSMLSDIINNWAQPYQLILPIYYYDNTNHGHDSTVHKNVLHYQA